MSVLNTFGNPAIRESMMDGISAESPEETYIGSTIAHERTGNQEFSYLMDGLVDSPFPETESEGIEVTNFKNQFADLERTINYSRKLTEPFAVTEEAQASDSAGIEDLVAKSITKAGQNFRIQKEKIIGGNQDRFQRRLHRLDE